jgi:catechol-2,3-dioxygenase
MHIQKVELRTVDLHAQRDFYSRILELPTEITSSSLLVKAGTTELLFTQAASSFDGAYHFAFNIPENQYFSAKNWISSRIPLLRDNTGKEDFAFESWNSISLYFLDSAGNILEFIARHALRNAVEDEFSSRQILNVSEVGLPSEDVIGLVNQLTTHLGLSTYKQEPNETFTAVGDDNGLFILPIIDRIWMPDSGVPARMLPVIVRGNTSGNNWEVRGVPYQISPSDQP